MIKQNFNASLSISSSGMIEKPFIASSIFDSASMMASMCASNCNTGECCDSQATCG